MASLTQGNQNINELMSKAKEGWKETGRQTFGDDQRVWERAVKTIKMRYIYVPSPQNDVIMMHYQHILIKVNFKKRKNGNFSSNGKLGGQVCYWEVGSCLAGRGQSLGAAGRVYLPSRAPPFSFCFMPTSRHCSIFTFEPVNHGLKLLQL